MKPIVKTFQAFMRVKMREHLSEIHADEAESAKKRESLLGMHQCDFLIPYSNRRTGTEARVSWTPLFTFIKALMVKPKNLNTNGRPRLINLYHHKETTWPFIDGFYCYDDSIESSAKLECTLLHKGHDTDRIPNYLYINAINSIHQCRLGSLLIQVAIEQSIRSGMDGRIKLNSTRSSGQFYFKLGFLPEDDEVFEALSMGKETNGGNMYLPEAAISAWKEKIAGHPIILTPQEIAQHIQTSQDPFETEYPELKQDIIKKTYKQLLELTQQYYDSHYSYDSEKAAIFQLLLSALQCPRETKYNNITRFVYILRTEDKNILNQHRDTFKHYIANVLSILLVLPALCRALHSYYNYNTLRFWQPESEKLKNYALNQCSKIGIGS